MLMLSRYLHSHSYWQMLWVLLLHFGSSFDFFNLVHKLHSESLVSLDLGPTMFCTLALNTLTTLFNLMQMLVILLATCYFVQTTFDDDDDDDDDDDYDGNDDDDDGDGDDGEA